MSRAVADTVTVIDEVKQAWDAFAAADLIGMAMDQANFQAKIKLDPFSYLPTFQLALRLVGLDVTKGLNFEARVRLSVLPSAAGAQAVWGLGSVWVDGPNNNACFVRFGATANGAVLIQSYDGTTSS